VYTVTKNITFNTFNGSDISNGSEVSVYCFAPMWDSFEWKNTSISFKVIGNLLNLHANNSNLFSDAV